MRCEIEEIQRIIKQLPVGKADTMIGQMRRALDTVWAALETAEELNTEEQKKVRETITELKYLIKLAKRFGYIGEEEMTLGLNECEGVVERF